MTSTSTATARRTLARALPTTLAATALLAGINAAPAAATTMPPVRHVFVIVLENKEFSETFGPGSQYAPYLTQTLVSQGALVPNYFGIGHSSADNYIAMVGGQPPTTESKNDCPDPLVTIASTSDANGVAQAGGGCVYPDNFLTVADQLAGAGLTWRAYAENIPSPCSLVHDAPGNYARKHNPFPFFLSVRDSGQCTANDVGLDALPTDLANGPANVSFIFPDECNDGHTDCTGTNAVPGAGSEADELAQADAFLKTWVPQITATPAYQHDGLLAIIWDEGYDPASCCGEPTIDPDGSFPGGLDGLPGAGGGQTGAVLLSPFIKPGTMSSASYNHYSLLASIEDLFGLPRLAEANLPGTTTFGPDVFTQPPS